MAEGTPELGPFPVDDATLGVLEHALGASYVVDEDEHEVVGADMTVPKLLDFLSGYDESKVVDGTYPGPVYTRDDVIRALIAEVRLLRKQKET